jgi:hypothetical protein
VTAPSELTQHLAVERTAPKPGYRNGENMGENRTPKTGLVLQRSMMSKWQWMMPHVMPPPAGSVLPSSLATL